MPFSTTTFAKRPLDVVNESFLDCSSRLRADMKLRYAFTIVRGKEVPRVLSMSAATFALTKLQVEKIRILQQEALLHYQMIDLILSKPENYLERSDFFIEALYLYNDFDHICQGRSILNRNFIR